MHAPIEAAAQAVTPEIGHLEALGARRCVVSLGARSSEEMARWLGVFGFDFEILEPAELGAAVATVADRFARAARAFRPRARRGRDRRAV